MQRFWSKVDKTDTCWVWTASRNSEGYGNFVLDGKVMKAHRVAYELLVGPIPNGLEIDHLCRNPSCVNPDHLEPVTHAENMRRGIPNSPLGRMRKAMESCSHGHPFDEANTKVRPNGTRACRKCHALREARRRALSK